MASKRRLKRKYLRNEEKRIENVRARHCGDDDAHKIAYPDEKLARDAAHAYSAKRNADISHYLCKFCGAWHIGHTPRGRK